MKFLKHPATIIATVALFVAFGGGAAAYASGLINGSQIKNHSIAAKKLTKSAIKSLHGQRGPTGPQGATGATGATGAQGPAGISSAKSTYVAGPIAYNGLTTIASMTLTAGSYVLLGNATIADGTENEDTVCYLMNGGTTIDQNYTATQSAGPTQSSISLMGPMTTTGGTVSVQCLSGAASTNAYYTHIVAMQVGAVSGTASHTSAKSSSSVVGG